MIQRVRILAIIIWLLFGYYLVPDLESLKNAASAPKLDVRCLVDAGALHLCIPTHIALQLGFDSDAVDKGINSDK